MQQISISMDGWLVGWLRFYGILNKQIAAISCLKCLKFISKTNGMYERNYWLGMNITEGIFDIRSSSEILANDIKIYTIDTTNQKCCFLAAAGEQEDRISALQRNEHQDSTRHNQRWVSRQRWDYWCSLCVTDQHSCPSLQPKNNLCTYTLCPKNVSYVVL